MSVLTNKIPTVAFFGLPNSGKSTLINRICGRGTAIVANEAHTTRDINTGYDWWNDMYIKFVDTGGLVPDPQDKIQSMVQIKSWQAIAQADLLVWVIDRRQDPETISESIVQRVWKTGKPFIIAINKVDDPNNEVEVFDYVRLGGEGFINFSAMNGYNMNALLDAIFDVLVKLGYEPGNGPSENLEETNPRKAKGRKHKLIKYTADGSILIYRERNEDGTQGNFTAFENKDLRTNKIEAIFFDFDNTLIKLGKYASEMVLEEFGLDLSRNKELYTQFSKLVQEFPEMSNSEVMSKAVEQLFGEHDKTKLADLMDNIMEEWVTLSPQTIEMLQKLKERDYKLYITTNSVIKGRMELFATKPESKLFNSIFTPREVGFAKPDPKYFDTILEKTGLDAKNVVFFDDEAEYVQAAIKVGLWGVKFEFDKTDVFDELEKIEYGFTDRVAKTPKILLLGRPNVGKSSLFNALIGQEAQIVTEIAGTTLSVNDIEVINPKTDKKYILLDTTGVRKPGKRTFGVESFATFRTIEAAHNADVVCLILDASQPLTAQDQVVAGITKETSAGIVIVANKFDLISPEQKKSFLKDITHKLNWLKTENVLWTSAKDIASGDENKLNEFWQAVDRAIVDQHKFISREDIRKLFNYLMKQKPPKKLHNQKRAVIYDLLYTQTQPPTFELLVRDKKTIHFSYIRFLENTIRRQFHLFNTGVRVKVREVRGKDVLK